MAGRGFSADFPSNPFASPEDGSFSYVGSGVIDETAMRALGFATAAEAAGSEVRSHGGDGSICLIRIVGVVQNMVIRSASVDAEPTLFFVNTVNPGFVAVHIAGEDRQVVLEDVDRVWRQMVPSVPLQRWFLRDDISGQYTGLSQRVVLLVMFSLVVISVAIAGLYGLIKYIADRRHGLIKYIADRRRKEMSLRKVLGANVNALLGLLGWQLLKPVIWASLLAWPISALVMNRWLDSFVSRVDVGLGAMLAATVLVLLVVAATVLGHI